MEIYCKNRLLLEKAVKLSKSLEIDHHNAVINIKRLPPSFTQMGIIEHPRTLGTTNIYQHICKTQQREIYHSRTRNGACQTVFKGEPMCEKEAYLLETTLDNDHQKRL